MKNIIPCLLLVGVLVQVELSMGPKKQSIYRHIYTLSELSSLGKLTGSTVSLDSGNRETQFQYRANTTLTDTSGVLNLRAKLFILLSKTSVTQFLLQIKDKKYHSESKPDHSESRMWIL